MNILDLIFPKKCLECGKGHKYICNNCLTKVAIIGYRSGNYSIFEYKGVIRKTIISLKYKFATDVANELTDLLVNFLKSKSKYKVGEFILVPIPIDNHRRNERGFNQTEVLGEKLALEMNWKYIPNLLLKTKETKHQVGLKGGERRKNLHGVFTINSQFRQYTKHNILLFDDVYTTGTTIKEAKKTLEDYGFTNIESLTIAG